MKFPRFFLAVLFLAASFAQSHAQQSQPQRSQNTEATLLADTTAVQPAQRFTVALRLRMDEHWHTYYKEPGESGLPTTIAWELPPGFKAGEIQWRTPQRIEVAGIVSYGYEGEVWLLTEITPPDSLEGMTTAPIRAQVEWLECKEICLPGGAKLELVLPVAGSASPLPPLPADLAQGFAAARAALESVAANSTAATSQQPPLSLPLALLFAFIGGLILNLMPCVLPVVSLKVLSLVEQSKATGSSPLVHGALFAAGTLVMFWLLGGILLALQAAGGELGWGFQLQDPRIVAVLAAIFLLLAMSLFGVFEIGSSLTQVQATGAGKVHSFLSGLLATIVASPCTAPFMGSALGFTLGQPGWVTLSIFTAVAAGLAAPYVLLTAQPALLRWVPRPGAWMETFKQLLAFPLLGTVLWLLSVLLGQVLPEVFVGTLVGLLVIAFAAWLFGRFQSPLNPSGTRLVTGGLAFVLLLVGLNLAVPSRDAMASSPRLLKWEAFDPDRIPQLRNEGRPVYVDFTATWCLTCQVNKRIALHNDRVQAQFAAKRVVLMKADWTNRDPVITRALAEFGRNAVPLNVLYPPDPQAPPLLLPEVLTPEIVLHALESVP